MDEKFWGEMLNVLKDVSTYLEKQDAFQERAKIDPAPKIAENPKAIEGGVMPANYKPADNIAKATTINTDAPVHIGNSPGSIAKDAEEEVTVDENEAEDVVDEVEETPEEGAEETPGNSWVPEEGAEGEEKLEDEDEELKSILKDIRKTLHSNQANVAEIVKAEIKKALPNVVKGETDKLLRKMGFNPTRSDVNRLDVSKSHGIDSVDEVKKSDDIKKSQDTDVEKIVTDLSKMSWTQLGQLREKTDGFQPFKR